MTDSAATPGSAMRPDNSHPPNLFCIGDHATRRYGSVFTDASVETSSLISENQSSSSRDSSHMPETASDESSSDLALSQSSVPPPPRPDSLRTYRRKDLSYALVIGLLFCGSVLVVVMVIAIAMLVTQWLSGILVR
ncbi:hypothetical protein F5Y15DRAFT_413746 [Xylariaceae sp. FL0016]|nr:hypothetical protein F5Y15DRAFT_413746 [Xylariaceae sp. FL0016]